MLLNSRASNRCFRNAQFDSDARLWSRALQKRMRRSKSSMYACLSCLFITTTPKTLKIFSPIYPKRFSLEFSCWLSRGQPALTRHIATAAVLYLVRLGAGGGRSVAVVKSRRSEVVAAPSFALVGKTRIDRPSLSLKLCHYSQPSNPRVSL